MTSSIFSPFDPSAYKKAPRNNMMVKGQFGSPGMGAPQDNLQAILDLIKQLNGGTPEPQDELTRTLEELSKPAVTGRF